MCHHLAGDQVSKARTGMNTSFAIYNFLCASRQATKAHDYSVNWIVGQGQPEIVNGSTGKTINDSTSRLSKKCRKNIIFSFLVLCAV